MYKINDLLVFRHASTMLACVYYTHISVQIHNYADMISCATCSKRPPVLTDRVYLAGNAVAKDLFYCFIVLLTLMRSRPSVDTTVSGSPFQSRMVPGKNEHFFSKFLEQIIWNVLLW
jgi:hypothetical protein